MTDPGAGADAGAAAGGAPSVPFGCAWADETIEGLFAATGGILDGHFVLTSGRHAARYLEKFWVLQYPEMAVEIGRRMADALAPYRPTLVVGPTTGGVLLAHETARQLGERSGSTVRGVFAERVDSGGRRLRRGWTVAPDERVVLVDDILTTGLSLIETVEAVRAAGAQPLAAAVIVDRSSGPIEGAPPLHALGRIEIPSWDASECPLCAGGSVPVKPGSR
jgi:orotate phosphoribosyltransferase